ITTEATSSTNEGTTSTTTRIITGKTNATTRVTSGKAPTARVMTYNIQFLNQRAARDGDRIAKLRKIIDDIKPTVVAVQEVEDRQAMELVFPADKWYVIIDDESP